MVQPETESRPILLSDYRNRRRVLGLRLAGLAMRRLPGLVCHSQLAMPLGHDPSSILQAERCQVGSGGVHPRIPA